MPNEGDTLHFWKHFSLNLKWKEDFKLISFEIAPLCLLAMNFWPACLCDIQNDVTALPATKFLQSPTLIFEFL